MFFLNSLVAVLFLTIVQLFLNNRFVFKDADKEKRVLVVCITKRRCSRSRVCSHGRNHVQVREVVLGRA